MIVHAFKCPGHFVQKGISYTIKSVDDKEELSKGWFLSLEDAAEFAGDKALVEVIQLSKKELKRVKKLEGLPVKPHKVVAESTTQNITTHEEVIVAEDPSLKFKGKTYKTLTAKKSAITRFNKAEADELD